MRTIFRLFLLTALAALTASAGIITIVFDNPNQAGLPGQTLSFNAVITHVGDIGDPDLYLNSDSLDFTMPGAILIDNFFANVPIFLAPGASSGSINVFDIVLSNSIGEFAGAYQLLGGADGGAFTAADNLAQANFSVTATPEPATVTMISAALFLLLRQHRARRSRRSDLTHGHSGN
jgi:hypothetical protein